MSWDRWGRLAMAVGWTIVTVGCVIVIVTRLT
jgi:hypothetical protein